MNEDEDEQKKEDKAKRRRKRITRKCFLLCVKERHSDPNVVLLSFSWATPMTMNYVNI